MIQRTYSEFSEDSGIKEIETVGIPSLVDEGEIEEGLSEILSIIKYE